MLVQAARNVYYVFHFKEVLSCGTVIDLVDCWTPNENIGRWNQSVHKGSCIQIL